MNKFFSLFFALLMVIGILGCSNQSENAGEEVSPDDVFIEKFSKAINERWAEQEKIEGMEDEKKYYEKNVGILEKELEIIEKSLANVEDKELKELGNQYVEGAKIQIEMFKSNDSQLQLEYSEKAAQLRQPALVKLVDEYNVIIEEEFQQIYKDFKGEATEINNTTEDNTDEKNTTLDAFNYIATFSTQTEELYVTGNIVIGQNEEVTPGIYDLEITGGSGNIFGDRSSVSSLFINWVGGAKGNTGGYPSKIRIILFEGDTLEFSNISKVKFNAVPEKVLPSNELGIGEFIVGRDIRPGDYKLSTNVKLNPEYENLGWDIRIYNDENGQSRDQRYTATNNDVAVSLKEGEVISISYDNTDHGSSSDDAKLIFTKFK